MPFDVSVFLTVNAQTNDLSQSQAPLRYPSENPSLSGDTLSFGINKYDFITLWKTLEIL